MNKENKKINDENLVENMDVKKNNLKLEQAVMAEIKSGRVKLRSRYIFLAEKLGVGSAITLTILLAVLFFNLFLFYLKYSDNLRYLSFGSFGLFAFLESFPYGLIMIFVLLIFVSGVIFKKSGILYQKSFGSLAVFLTLGIMFLGIVLTFTSLAEMIEHAAYNNRPGAMIFKPFFKSAFDNRHSGVAGRIIEIGNNYLIIQTPDFEEKLDVRAIEYIPDDLGLGAFVAAVGERAGESFRVFKIRIINPDEMPMIMRGVNHQFGERPDLDKNLNPDFSLGRCMNGCMRTNLTKEECAGYCLPNNIN